MSDFSPMSTTYRMKLAPDLDDARQLEVYAGNYEPMGIDEACVSVSSDGLYLWVTISHPHSADELADFEKYLCGYYQRSIS